MADIDLGLALMDLEETYRIRLSRDFGVISGPEPSGGPLGPFGAGGFLDRLSEKDGELFRMTARRLGPDGMAGCVVGSAAGGPVELVVSRQEYGYDVFCKDVGRRMRSLERLAIFYRYFRKSPNPICFTDADANIVEANRAFLDFYGYGMEELRGKNPRILKSCRQTPGAYQEMWARISDPDSGSWTGEVINRRADGEEVHVVLTVTAVRRSDCSLIGYIASATDVTPRKRLEERLTAYNAELVEADRMKDELIAITSHDLKAPLNSIINIAGMVKEISPEIRRDQLLEYMDRIVSHGHRLTEFISDILDMDRIESGRMGLNTRRVRLDSALRSCVETNSVNAKAKGVSVVYTVHGTPEPVVVDAVKMEQVFNNLLSNAVKFSPEGSEIKVSYTDQGRGAPKSVGISDRGPGIPEGDTDRIFGKYYQVERKGAVAKRGFGASVGLGLNIVKSIVELHGGSVRAANGPDGGCVFTVEIPATNAVTTGSDVAAVIHDPASVKYGRIEHALKSQDVSCYITKDIHETRRVVEYEAPRLVFVHAEAADRETLSYLSGLVEGGDGPMLVCVGDASGPVPPFHRALSAPVTDVEVLGLLKGLRLT